MEHELQRHLMDLAGRCIKLGSPTVSVFLSPAEQAETSMLRLPQGCELQFYGGDAQCERRLAVFFPDYYPAEDINTDRMLAALSIRTGGEVTHRDILGAVLATGLKRNAIGDIRVFGNRSFLFVLPQVVMVLKLELQKVAKYHAAVEAVPLSLVPELKLSEREISATVMSLRLDAVTAALFSLSRTKAAEQIRAGNVSLNYVACLHCDAELQEGAMISLRGHGKGVLFEIGGNSRKGRTFIKLHRYQ